MMHTLELLWGTVVNRPYVYMFFICFLVFSLYHMGLKRTLTYILLSYAIAFGCEYSSTRNGFPFGLYTYFDDARSSELWISNVPFWDSLSFVFLSYFSFVVASELFGRTSRITPYFGGVIMTLLDVVIDPVALQGEKWFLGKIYNYPVEGFYFGVTAANFMGWFFVGFATIWCFGRALEWLPWCKAEWRSLDRRFIWAVYLVYAGVFGFNLGITLFIRDFELAKASALVSGTTLVVLAALLGAKQKRGTVFAS